ncbi:hypothetical protein FGU46_00375 [Methanobacterium sp. CWC-01]|uniref:hypothetical protein n=1 Tax=Methanobacterium aridiramus TaxID=2584467 RepID=UPI002577D01E|nr:hypothetical protein [Methanobacterium sp. CWC-01]WJI08653.1 hypothetical protein FGU46_00375 [Methanobacterium sp. CWC-01]
MNKSIWIGAVGGLCIFIIILWAIFFYNSDFDQELIQSSESGVACEKLIKQIDKESDNQKSLAENHLEGHFTDIKYWNNPNDPEKELTLEIDFYQQQIKAINNCTELRKKYVRKEISKEEFLAQIKQYKIMMSE